MKKTLQNKRVGIIGFGRLGHLLAPLLEAKGATVHGFRRNPENITINSVVKQALDVDQPIKSLPEMDYWVVTLSPGGRSPELYQKRYVGGLQHILQALSGQNFNKLFWVSSSSVYGQNQGEAVNEESDTKPTRVTGEILLQAETLLKSLEAKACAVRFSGIYNSRKSRVLQQLQQGEVSAMFEDYITNRIHENDAARVLVHLISLDNNGEKLEPLYLASDDCPVNYSDYVAYLTEKTGLQLNENLPFKENRVGSKRCDNSRLKATGFQLQYPSFKEGLAPLIIQHHN